MCICWCCFLCCGASSEGPGVFYWLSVLCRCCVEAARYSCIPVFGLFKLLFDGFQSLLKFFAVFLDTIVYGNANGSCGSCFLGMEDDCVSSADCSVRWRAAIFVRCASTMIEFWTVMYSFCASTKHLMIAVCSFWRTVEWELEVREGMEGDGGPGGWSAVVLCCEYGDCVVMSTCVVGDGMEDGSGVVCCRGVWVVIHRWIGVCCGWFVT